MRGRLLWSISAAGALRLVPGTGELDRDAGGEGGSSGAGGADSGPKIFYKSDRRNNRIGSRNISYRKIPQ